MVTVNKRKTKKGEHKEERPEASIHQFEEYCKVGLKDHGAFDLNSMAGIELMRLMNVHGGSLVLYDDIVKWHSKHLKATRPPSHKLLHERLMDRYNMKPKMPFEIAVDLPSSKETVHIPVSYTHLTLPTIYSV